jgi:hypothetical protein
MRMVKVSAARRRKEIVPETTDPNTLSVHFHGRSTGTWTRRMAGSSNDWVYDFILELVNPLSHEKYQIIGTKAQWESAIARMQKTFTEVSIVIKETRP